MSRPPAVSTRAARGSVASGGPPGREPLRASGTAASRFVLELRATLSRGAPGVPALVAAAEMVCGDRTGFARWLVDLARDPDSVRAIVARSYWHPNGFAKLVLYASAEPEFKIRMHVWPASGRTSRGETNPHSHRWEFASTLLVGQGLALPEYREVTRGGELFTRYRYGVDPARPAVLVADGPVRLVARKTRLLSRGGVYSCDTQVIHTAEPLGRGLTATLVIQGPHRTSTTAVFCVPGQSDDQPNGSLSVADFHLLVQAVLAEVGECSSHR